jgi:hypothetical protein
MPSAAEFKFSLAVYEGVAHDRECGALRVILIRIAA